MTLSLCDQVTERVALGEPLGELAEHVGKPFFPGLVTYLPLVPLGIWIGLLWSTDAEAAAFEKTGANAA